MNVPIRIAICLVITKTTLIFVFHDGLLQSKHEMFVKNLWRLSIFQNYLKSGLLRGDAG